MCACVRVCVRSSACACACRRVCVRAYGSAKVRAHVRLCMCLCVHVRARVGEHAFAGAGQRTCGLCACVRACEFICMYDYYIILL